MLKFLITLLAVGLLASTAAMWVRPNRQSPVQTESWRHELEQGKSAAEKGDLYGASNHYSRATRIAGGENDWEGLVTIACELFAAGSLQGSGFNAHMLLVRAMVAAEKKQSPGGLRVVADAFRMLGESHAELALSRIGADWPGGDKNAILRPMKSPWRCAR